MYNFKLGSINTVVEIYKLNLQNKLKSNQDYFIRFYLIAKLINEILSIKTELVQNSFKFWSINSVTEICKLNVQDKHACNQESLIIFYSIDRLTTERFWTKTEVVPNSLLPGKMIRHMRFDKRCLCGITKFFSPHNDNKKASLIRFYFIAKLTNESLSTKTELVKNSLLLKTW